MKRDFKAILLHLAKYFKVRYGLKGEINDTFFKNHLGFIADKLDMKVSVLSVRRGRNSIPHEVILDYCLKEEIDPFNVFYDKKARP